MSEDDTNLVATAADLGRRDAERKLSSTAVDAGSALFVTKLRTDEQVEVTSLERHLGAPLRPRGTAMLHHPEDFAEYVNRLGSPDHTTVWADPDAGKFVAVFDDHVNADEAGWRSHTATLALQADPDWTAWMSRNGKGGDQATFAEHLEDLAHTVVNPDAATMIEVATSFNAKRSVNFASAVRTDSGDITLNYEETTKAQAGRKGSMDIPAEFTVKIAPFVGTEPSEIQARLRYRIAEGQLVIGYALLRPDLVRRDIITSLIGQLRESLASMPVFMGTPPPAVQAAS